MIKNLFRKTTADDILKELKKTTFKINKINSMIQSVDINHKNQDLQTFLHSIIIENHTESVKWLLNNKINYNAVDAHGETALIIACKHGYTSALSEILKKKDANVDYEDYDGYTAIDYSIINNNYDTYKLIKSYVYDINKRNKDDKTIMHLAIKYKNYKVIDNLLQDTNFTICNEILFYQYTYSNEEMMHKILSNFKDLNIRDKTNRNMLFYVIENGYKSLSIFDLLLKKGLDINCIDKEGNNILLHLIETILDKKNTFIQEKPEDLEKHNLEISNLINIIPHILENDIDTFTCNNKNETILSLCAKEKQIDLLNTFFDYEVFIDMLNRNNESALSSIITEGEDYLDVIYMLLDFGANTNMKDKEGRTTIEKLLDAILIIKNNKKVKNSEKNNLSIKTDYNKILETVLFNADVNLSLLNSKDEPYIFDVLRHNNIDLVKVLVKHGSDINSHNIIYKYMEENRSFKKDIDQREYHNNLQTIIMMGANVNAKDSYGGITLHKAILDCDITAIKLLLHSGADMHAIDNRGRNIVHNSIWKNNIKIFRMIYSYNKTLLNEPDKFGVLPINYAAFLGYTDLVLELIELSAYINNPYNKSKYILNFLKKFHKNLKPLEEEARTKVQKIKIKKLIENMKEEFEVKES